jgi:UDP-N-acetylmuramate: L-alanyl-gamma-D-glutamyl-meso-diaminopimelate ligase
MKHYHFIAIGGAVMHQLAAHLRSEGNTITGSDDAIFDPAKSNLEKLGLMPEAIGWFPEKINGDIDAVILGMHAKADNPELLKAQELGIRVYSFPEFIYEQCKDKMRIAVAGSHGKTSITSMIMHMLRENGKTFDYLVGAKLDGFDFMVKSSATAPLMVIEADEYLTSPIDLKSKFLHYRPHIAVISGIAWDHINVFPTFESYLDTFRKFIESIQPDGYLIYYAEDEELQKMVEVLQPDINLVPYYPFAFKTENDKSLLHHNGNHYEVKIFGSHNFANLRAAFETGLILGLPEEAILSSFSTFSGAAKRLEKYTDDTENNFTVYRDFAHAPSKVRATVKAVRERYEKRKIIAVFELHTCSSLQENFIGQYEHSLDAADIKFLFLDEEALKIKNKQDLDETWLKAQFADESIRVYKNAGRLLQAIQREAQPHTTVLLMSSGNLGGMNIDEIKLK